MIYAEHADILKQKNQNFKSDFLVFGTTYCNIFCGDKSHLMLSKPKNIVQNSPFVFQNKQTKKKSKVWNSMRASQSFSVFGFAPS